MSFPLPAPSASPEEIIALEHASLCAWPALETAPAGPFLLRQAHGFTKRANSAVLAFPPPAPLSAPETAASPILPDALFRDICAWYAARSLPPLFRIPQAADRGLDTALAARGCPVQEISLVMSRPLGLPAQPFPCISGGSACTAPQPSEHHPRQVAFLSRREWLSAARHLLTDSPAAQAALEQMLALHTGHCDFPAIHHGSTVVACALGVCMDGMYGLYSIRTAKACRRQGCGTALVSAMVQQAQQLGAHTVWLQVLAANAPAIRLYERFGFAPRYRYWYRSA